MSKADVFGNLDDDLAIDEVNPTTKLERRRKIEEMHEEKRLREELEDYETLF